MSDNGNFINDSSDSAPTPELVPQGGDLQTVVDVARRAMLSAESLGDERVRYFEIPFADPGDCLFWSMGVWVPIEGGKMERASVLARNALAESLNISVRSLAGGARRNKATGGMDSVLLVSYDVPEDTGTV